MKERRKLSFLCGSLATWDVVYCLNTGNKRKTNAAHCCYRCFLPFFLFFAKHIPYIFHSHRFKIEFWTSCCHEVGLLGNENDVGETCHFILFLFLFLFLKVVMFSATCIFLICYFSCSSNLCCRIKMWRKKV